MNNRHVLSTSISTTASMNNPLFVVIIGKAACIIIRPIGGKKVCIQLIFDNIAFARTHRINRQAVQGSFSKLLASFSSASKR